MRVLVLGWEFPPRIVGGLGMACYGLCRGLAAEGARVTVALPADALEGSRPERTIDGVRVVKADRTGRPAPGRRSPATSATSATSHAAASAPRPRAAEAYDPAPPSAEPAGEKEPERNTPAAILSAVHHYAAGVERLARAEPFDLIHAHDWMTFEAGMRARAVSGRPLVCHVHSTEFERSGTGGHRTIAEIERRALRSADRVLAVSDRTRGVVVRRYGVDPERVVVVYNAVDGWTLPPPPGTVRKPWERVVVFLGRLALQKGPDYFVEAAHRVLERMEGVKFIVAGRGPMLPRLVERVARLRRGTDILFAGFLEHHRVGRLLGMADCYVMTSVEEPFGIAALEAMSYGVPAIIPRNAGVGEVVRNVLRVDFWDIDRLADRIIAVLRHAPLRHAMGRLAREEAGRMSWRAPARRCLEIYRNLLAREGLA